MPDDFTLLILLVICCYIGASRLNAVCGAEKRGIHAGI